MKVSFTKMQGAANDYIYVDCFKETIDDPSSLAVAMSPRHFSVGADGLVLIMPSSVADARMRMFNADGSEGKMCGNAIRCVGKYVYDAGYAKKEVVTVETLSGIKTLKMKVEDGVAVGATVDMGIVTTDPKVIPISSEEPYVDKSLVIDGKDYKVTCVSVGNPHVVVYVDNVDDFDVFGVGSKFEKDAFFPESVNTEFVEVVDSTHLKMRVWERGSGETYACGTGASATVAASCLNGLCPYDVPVEVKLLGGNLYIEVKKDLRVFMTGAAKKVYDGVYEYEDQGK
ncbi:MAG: diaminopimelate epimerase [Clostridia bacterium]|nr:diaminopimelate epimerase [Clostridia bacterium]